MNLTVTSKLPGKALGSFALAGSLFLHVGLIAAFSFWQLNWTPSEKTSPKVVHVKFISASPSSQSTETANTSKPTPMIPAQPLAMQSISKSRPVPRTPDLSTPTFQTAKAARQMIRSHKKIIKRPLAQPTYFAATHLFPAATPANFPQPNQRTIIHRRSPIVKVNASKFPNTPARTAISTKPANPKFNSIRRLPNPAQSMAFSQADFASQPKAEQPNSKILAKEKFATLPREFSQSQVTDGDTPDTGPGDLRGLFTGKVRQRIASAKYYPRVARRRGMEGQPVIAFTLDKEGRLTKVDLAQTSGYQLLDQAALEAVHRAAPYPEIPAELNMDIIQFKLPISFVLK